jgi:phage gpG-like protein
MTRATFEQGAKLKRIGNKLVDPSKALKQIGVTMVAESEASFKAQRFGRKAWRERSPINVFGIIADFAQGRRKPPARRFETRPALRDTGRLANSIAFSVSGKVVEVGTNVPYASLHNFGGVSKSEKITLTVQQRIGKWLAKQSEDLQERLGWLLGDQARDEQLEMRVPKRQFVGITIQTRKEIRKTIGVRIMEVDR